MFSEVFEFLEKMKINLRRLSNAFLNPSTSFLTNSKPYTEKVFLPTPPLDKTLKWLFPVFLISFMINDDKLCSASYHPVHIFNRVPGFMKQNEFIFHRNLLYQTKALLSLHLEI